jgi:cardiolipin synthase
VTTTPLHGSATTDPFDPTAGADRRHLQSMLGVPFTDGNAVDVLLNGAEVFPALLPAVESATRSVDMLWFLWGHEAVTEQMAAALAHRAGSGVRVRALLDGFGARGIAADQVRRTRDAGALVEFLHPLSSWRATALNLRTHRRVLVCDESVAFTGGSGSTGRGPETPRTRRTGGTTASGCAARLSRGCAAPLRGTGCRPGSR